MHCVFCGRNAFDSRVDFEQHSRQCALESAREFDDSESPPGSPPAPFATCQASLVDSASFVKSAKRTTSDRVFGQSSPFIGSTKVKYGKKRSTAPPITSHVDSPSPLVDSLVTVVPDSQGAESEEGDVVCPWTREGELVSPPSLAHQGSLESLELGCGSQEERPIALSQSTAPTATIVAADEVTPPSQPPPQHTTRRRSTRNQKPLSVKLEPASDATIAPRTSKKRKTPQQDVTEETPTTRHEPTTKKRRTSLQQQRQQQQQQHAQSTRRSTTTAPPLQCEKIVTQHKENVPSPRKKRGLAIKEKEKQSICLTGSTDPAADREVLAAAVKHLGCFQGGIVSTVDASTTHIVVCSPAATPRRTLNLLHALSRNCVVLPFEWVMESIENEAWLPTQPYRLTMAVHEPRFFANRAFFIASRTAPSPAELRLLILSLGGRIVHSHRQADCFVGSPTQFPSRGGNSCECISPSRLLDAILPA